MPRTDDPMRGHRAKRLQEYLDRYVRGDTPEERHAAFLNKAGRTKGWLSQVRRNLGYQAATDLAKRLGLPDPGWFDRPIGTPKRAQPADARVAEECADYLPDQRHATCGQSPSAAIDNAVRVIAERLLETPEPQREAAAAAIRVLASAPQHWRQVASILNGETGPRSGGSDPSLGSDPPLRKSG